MGKERLRRAGLFALWLLSISFIFIENGFTATLTFKDCLQRAQQSSYRLKADEQKVNAAQKSYQFDRSQTLPQLSGELTREQRHLQPYSFHQQLTLIHSDWSLGDFFLKTARATQREAMMVRALKEQTRLEVIRRAALLYVNILQKQTQTDLLQKRLDLLEAHYNVAKALWRAGARTQLDVLQTETEKAQLKEQMATIELERDNLLQELARLVNWQDAGALQLQPIDAAEICARPAPKVRSETLQSNPLVQALEFQIKAQRIRTQTVKAQQLPRLHVSGGYMADGDPTGDGNYWQVDAGIELPLFQWGATKFQRQQSQALVRSLESQKKELERELTIHTGQTLARLEKLKSVMSLQNERLQTTEKAFQFAEANYKAGLITNLEYLFAQQQLMETQIAIQETQLEYVMNLIEFYVTTNQVQKIEEIGY